MAETDRFLGAFEEFKQWEAKEHLSLHERLVSIEQKVDSLRMSRERLYGVAAVLGALAGYIAKFL